MNTILRSHVGRTAVFGLVSCLALLIPLTAQATDLSGSWSGTWQSTNSPHHGPLQAEFVRLDQNHYEVFFKGRFFKVFPFRYSVVMSAVEQNGVVHLSGSKFLGRMFGTFSFRAAATSNTFSAAYTSCKDNGRFELSRCGYPPCCARSN